MKDKTQDQIPVVTWIESKGAYSLKGEHDTFEARVVGREVILGQIMQHAKDLIVIQMADIPTVVALLHGVFCHEKKES
jgi:hypothetical protein